MAPMETMIREVFKGQERFAMLSELYRQHGYSQFMTLRASIGVLLQIPFFFAAYHLLSHMDALHGVSFGPIRDLGAADALFAIGGVSINVLPILMTVVNLVSAFFYTHDLSRRDKVQLYGMAALFLVLLYNSPAALTFYWTLNNVYSLGKNIVEKDWMKRRGWKDFERRTADSWARLGRKIGSLPARYSCFARVLDIQVRLSIIAGIVGATALFMLVRGLSGRQDYSFALSIMLFATFALLAAVCLCKNESFARFKRLSCLRALGVLVAVIGCAYIVAKYGFYQFNLNKVVTKTVTVGAVTLAFLYGKTLWAKIRDKVLAQKKELGALFLPAAGLIAFLIFVYCPFMVFSSDPVVFDMKLEDFASGRFGTFFVAMIVLAVIHTLIRPVRWAFGSIAAVMALAALLFCFVVAPDVGVMDTFIFQNPEALTQWYNGSLDSIVISATIILFAISVYFYKIQILKIIIHASISTLIAMTLIHYNDANHIISKIAINNIDNFVNKNSKLMDIHIPSYVSDFFNFSKNGKNIIIVVLDMFTGGHMNQILDMHPELKDELEGFIWYEDTITAGSNTFLGNNCILAGKDAHPFIINSTNDSRSLEEKVNCLRGTFLRTLQEKNFRLSIYESMLFDIELTKKYIIKNSNDILITGSSLWEDAGYYWAKKFNYKEFLEYENFTVQNYDKFLYLISLYNICPLSYKKSLYQDGAWKNTISRVSAAFKRSLIDLGNLEICTDASKVSNSKGNSFIYFMSNSTNRPWTLDETGMPTKTVADLESRDWNNNGLSIAHIRTEYVALKKLINWFKWMKKNEVYDNTQIILVSDHGMGDSAGVVNILGPNSGLNPHGLMLVKNFGRRGPLHIDRTSLMANWDVQSLVNNNFAQHQEDIKQEWMNPNRVRPHATGHWHRNKHFNDKFKTDMMYQIKGPMYDIKSWNPVPDKR